MENLAQATLTISILGISIFWCIAVIFKNLKNRNAPPSPPGPWGLPVVGYLPFLGPELQIEFTKLARKYGQIVKLQLGTKLYVVLSSPSLVKEVTRDQDTVFANRDPNVAAEAFSLGGSDIAWSNGPYWRNMRKLFVREMLSGSNLDACYDLRKDEVLKAVKHVGVRIGTPVGLGELAFLTEINTIMRMLWGWTLEEHQLSRTGADFMELFHKLVEVASKPNLSDFFPILRRFDIQGIEKEARAIILEVGEVLDVVMSERVEKDAEDEMQNGGKKDFIQILHDLKKLEDTGEEITMIQKKGILMDIVVGGTDTTATMTEWVMAQVIHHREVMEKIHEELGNVVGLDNEVEEFHLSKLHYLEAVVKETFRLHPAVPLLLPRSPTKSSTVGGYYIPKGATVFINAWAIQRDPEFWDNPLEFRPERFLNEPKKWDYNGNNFQFMPFGSGRRVCPGIPLAERMLMHLLAALMHSFDWKPTLSKEEDLSEKFGLVLKKTTPLLAIPTKRTHLS